MLDIVANYHHIQFQGKHMTQTQEKREKLALARFRQVGLKFGPPILFLKNLALSVTRYHGQLS